MRQDTPAPGGAAATRALCGRDFTATAEPGGLPPHGSCPAPVSRCILHGAHGKVCRIFGCGSNIIPCDPFVHFRSSYMTVEFGAGTPRWNTSTYIEIFNAGDFPITPCKQ